MRVKKVSSITFSKDSIIFLFTEEQISGKEKMNVKPPQLMKHLDEFVKKKDFKGKSGEASYFFSGKTLVLLVGLGKSKEVTGAGIREMTGRAILSPKLSSHKEVEVVPHDNKVETYRAVTEGAVIGTYRWKKYITKKKDEKVVEDKLVHLLLPDYAKFKETVTIAEGVNYVRNLVNENADVMDSSAFEREIKKIVKSKKNVKVTLLRRKDLKKKGLNLHLAVNQGSDKEPVLAIIKYSGGKGKYTAIIGKGITFDTGGLNLKPTGYIETMRHDMGGAAAVLGTLRNVIELKPKKNVIFVLGIAENAIGPKAVRPGDVVKSYDGKTVEITNTDAEGRLVLADANAYVTKNYDVRTVINIATLTGAVIVALGHDYTGVMSNRENLADKLLKSGKETDDLTWQLPIYPELKDLLKSKYADIKNVGHPKGAAGTMTAGEFLREFAGEKDWAHLDIAGTAFVDADRRMYYGYGATGSGVRLLTHYVMRYA